MTIMNRLLTEVDPTVALTRGSLYRLLAKSFLYPTPDIIEILGGAGYGEILRDYTTLNKGSSKLQRSVDEMTNFLMSPDNWRRDSLEPEYNRLFAHIGSAECPPYETEYGYDNIFQKTEALADIAGFYRAYELDVADGNKERVDFLSTELEFMSFLALHEAYAREQSEQEHLEVTLDSQRKYLQDHLGRWMSMFAKVLAQSTREEFYRHLGGLTDAFVESEVQYLGVTPEKVTVPGKGLHESPSPFGCDACMMNETERTKSTETDNVDDRGNTGAAGTVG